jgi:putative molybdopterin biosynthesis protein
MVKRYLEVRPLAEAQTIVSRSFRCIPSIERVAIEQSTGRVIATPVIARYSVPEIHLAAMDGIAVKSEDTVGADEQHPVTLARTARVNTGNIVSPEYDAVIMIEDVWVEHEQYGIRKAVPPWQHIRPAGEDIGESEMVLASRHTIRPHEIGALAAYGITDVDVLNVRVGLIPTGSELVDHHTRPAPGQIVESNTLMAAAVLTKAGAQCTRYPIVRDAPELIRKAVQKALAANEIVIVSAGSSAGTRDYTADVIADLGEVLVHGIAIKPGKPAIIGRVDGKPVIGMPGYPLSAFTILREIVLPLLGQYGLSPAVPETLEGQFTTTLHKDIGTEEFVLCAAGRVGSRWVISPLSRGASVQMSAVRANSYITIPPGVEGMEKGEPVTATLMVPRADAEQALLVTGSHDPALDYLADLLRYRNVDLHSTNVGSMGGIIALMNDECHATPMHLLAKDGSFNIPYLEKHMPGEEIVLVCVAERQQGVISRDGLGFDDLTHHIYVNRQKGAGTRILLDFELQKRGIDPLDIRGYDREVTTHLAVALAVKSGEADAGMGVFSAAQALHLQFVPVATERYELAIRASHRADSRVKALVETISSPKFKAVLERLGGYDIKETGVQRTLP